MKNELDLMVERVQSEYDYLKKSLDACVAEMDFEGAQYFQKPLQYTQEKLRILKYLQNPIQVKISSLNRGIARLENKKYEDHFNSEYLDQRTIDHMRQYYQNKIFEKIEKNKLELERLTSLQPKKWVDNDTLLQLLDELYHDLHNGLEIEFIKDELFLNVTKTDTSFLLILTTEDNNNINDYLVDFTKVILKKLGFSEENYALKVESYSSTSKFEILEILSIITLEVFRLKSDQELNVRIL